MKTFIFRYYSGWNEEIVNVAEYDYDVSWEKVQYDFREWAWSMIGDRFRLEEE